MELENLVVSWTGYWTTMVNPRQWHQLQPNDTNMFDQKLNFQLITELIFGFFWTFLIMIVIELDSYILDFKRLCWFFTVYRNPTIF